MIIPGQTTLELLIGSELYAIALYIVPPLFSALAAYVGDSLADASLQNKVRAGSPEAMSNPAVVDLTEVYEFEHISQPIGAGLLAGMIVIYPAISLGIGLESAIPLAIVTGLAARKVLGTAAASFVAQRKV